MTETQIQLVKKSWRILRGIPPEVVADTFYSKLFIDHPKLRRLFPKQMDEQYKKLFDMMSSIVVRLDDLENIRQEIIDMGMRHKGYGVQPGHYAMVGEAMLWTLEKGLGADWNAEIADAWLSCYTMIAAMMQEA